MKSRIVVSMLIIALIVVFFASCGPPPTPEPTPTPTVHPGESLVSTKCIGCHDINRVTNASYDEMGWQLTVDRMVMSGAQLNEDQVSMVVDYLAENYPDE